MKKIAIIDYGAGNIRSVTTAFQRLDCNIALTDNAEEIQASDGVIFPGVGHAKDAMKNIKERGLHHLIPQLQQPLLGICLGMQLLCKHSEEGNVDGLGIFPNAVKKFQLDHLNVPHMGWNHIQPKENGTFMPEEGDYYFVHSYFVEVNEYTAATCEYGHDFSAVLHKENFYATQFHPEKSGDLGMSFLEHFLKAL